MYMKYSKDFAVTITLKPKLYGYEPMDQYKRSIEYVKAAFPEPEFRTTLVWELTPQAKNIHYHGFISVRLKESSQGKPIDLVLKLQNRLRPYNHVLGLSTFKEVTDYEIWKDYISKDIRQNYDTFSEYSVCMDHYNMFPHGVFEYYKQSEPTICSDNPLEQVDKIM